MGGTGHFHLLQIFCVGSQVLFILYKLSPYLMSLALNPLNVPQLLNLPCQRDWELLQRIYVKMSEFDGVAGVTASRNTPASLREQIQG